MESKTHLDNALEHLATAEALRTPELRQSPYGNAFVEACSAAAQALDGLLKIKGLDGAICTHKEQLQSSVPSEIEKEKVSKALHHGLIRSEDHYDTEMLWAIGLADELLGNKAKITKGDADRAIKLAENMVALEKHHSTAGHERKIQAATH
jgi:hypothetical protein